MTANTYPSTGLYYNNSTASLIHCSVETEFYTFEAEIQLELLFQNTSEEDMVDAIFHCQFDCDEAAVTSFSCHVKDVASQDSSVSFERRLLRRAVKSGTMFQCSVGEIPKGGEAQVLISWSTSLPVIGEDTIALSIPLPNQPEADSFSISALSLRPGMTMFHSIKSHQNIDILDLVCHVERLVEDHVSLANMALSEMWDSDYYGSDFEDSAFEEDSAFGDEEPVTPTFGFDFSPKHYCTETEDEEFVIKLPTAPWNSPVCAPVAIQDGDDEEVPLFHCLSAPPAYRKHPFMDDRQEASSEIDGAAIERCRSPSRVPILGEHRASISLDHVRPEF